MDQDVNEVKTDEIQSTKLIVERKTDIGNRAAGSRTLESGPKEIVQAERRHADMRIVPNVVDVI